MDRHLISFLQSAIGYGQTERYGRKLPATTLEELARLSNQHLTAVGLKEHSIRSIRARLRLVAR